MDKPVGYDHNVRKVDFSGNLSCKFSQVQLVSSRKAWEEDSEVHVPVLELTNNIPVLPQIHLAEEEGRRRGEGGGALGGYLW